MRVNGWLCMMEVKYRCDRQAQEGCWDGGEEEGNGEKQRCKDLPGSLLRPFLM